jgi:uncharacterized membrane protein
MNKLPGNIPTFEEGLRVYKKYWKEIYLAFGAAILASVAIFLLMFLLISGSAALGNNAALIPIMGVLVMILYVLMFVVIFGVQVGITKIALDAVGDKKPDLRDLYRNYKRIPSYIFTNYLTTIITYIGVILLIVPGFILFARYQLAGVFVVDRGVGLSEALSLSDRATKGNIWGVIKFDIFLFLLNLLAYLLVIILGLVGNGFIAMIGLVGFIFTIPLTLISFIVMYKKLSSGV